MKRLAIIITLAGLLAGCYPTSAPEYDQPEVQYKTYPDSSEPIPEKYRRRN